MLGWGIPEVCVANSWPCQAPAHPNLALAAVQMAMLFPPQGPAFQGRVCRYLGGVTWMPHALTQVGPQGSGAGRHLWERPTTLVARRCQLHTGWFRRLHVAGRHNTLPSPGQGGASSFSPSGSLTPLTHSGPRVLLCLTAAGQHLSAAGAVPCRQGLHHSRPNSLGRPARHRRAGAACDGHAGEAACRPTGRQHSPQGGKELRGAMQQWHKVGRQSFLSTS